MCYGKITFFHFKKRDINFFLLFNYGTETISSKMILDNWHMQAFIVIPRHKQAFLCFLSHSQAQIGIHTGCPKRKTPDV